MLKMIAWTEFIGPWRKWQSLPLIGFSIGLSLIVALIPHRLSSESALWPESLLAIQVLQALLFILLVTVYSMAPSRFKWSSLRTGPLPIRSEWLLLAQTGGQIAALTAAWLPLFLFQVIILPRLTDIQLSGAFAARSLATWLGGVALVGWAQIIAVILPTSAAMLSTVALVVAGQFLLSLQLGAETNIVALVSPGLEFVLGSTSLAPSMNSWVSMVTLVLSIIGISNLLSAWILEAWHGILCSLDQGETRS